MPVLISSLGEDNQEKVVELCSKFDIVYVISEIPKVPEFVKASVLIMPDASAKELSDALHPELKSLLSKEKILELDIAVSMISGSGKLHAAIMSAVMKLGYGIRLVDLDEKGNI